MARSITAVRVQKLLGSSWERSPVYAALADGLRLLISDGRIPAGTRLPSERELTSALGVSRTTVTRAYDQLRERGYLRSRQGSGSVASVPQVAGGRTDSVLSPGPGAGDADTLDLTCAAPVSPPGVAAAFEAAVDELPAFLGGTGYFPSGLPALKERIAARYTERGLPTSPEQILVTNGALSATAVVARGLISVGDRVMGGDPRLPEHAGQPAADRRPAGHHDGGPGGGLGHRRRPGHDPTGGADDRVRRARLPQPHRVAHVRRATSGDRRNPSRPPTWSPWWTRRSSRWRSTRSRCRRRWPLTSRTASRSAAPARRSGAVCASAGSAPSPARRGPDLGEARPRPRRTTSSSSSR